MKDQTVKNWWRRLWPLVMLTVYLLHTWTRPENHRASWSPADLLVIMGCLALAAVSFGDQAKKIGLSWSEWGYRTGLTLCLTGLALKLMTRL